jgi:hypothetical protein
MSDCVGSRPGLVFLSAATATTPTTTMASFSWSDTLHACLPCFRPESSSDEPTHQRNPPRVPNLPRDAHAALQSLLIADSESSSATEADTVSLHSNIGSSRERRRRKKNKNPSPGFVLFGYHLFGTPDGAIRLPDSDDEGTHTESAPNPTKPKGKKGKKRSIGALSGTSIDPDAALLAQNAVDQATVDAFAKEERKRARKQRKEEKKRLAVMLNMSGEAEEFEGFPGSGDGSFFAESYPHDTSFAEHGDDWNVIPRVQDDPEDAHADLGGESYVRQQPRTSNGGSGSGSQTRSRTSASVSDGPSTSSYNVADHDHHSSQTPMLPQESRRKERRRKKSVSSKSATMSNDSSSITTASLASPSHDAQYIMPPEIMSPTSPEYHASGYMDLRNQTNKTPTDSYANGNMFPSTRLVANRQARRSDVGVFLN